MSNGSTRDIYGLSELHVCPKLMGLGSLTIAAIVKLAELDGKSNVIGFAESNVVGFYKKCGWWTGGTYYDANDGYMKHMIAWKPVEGKLAISSTDLW